MVFPASFGCIQQLILKFGPSLSFTFEEFIMELLDLASSCIHLSDRIVDFVFRSTFPRLCQHGTVAALLSFQAFDNASISSGVIGGFGMRQAYQRERFLGKAF